MSNVTNNILILLLLKTFIHICILFYFIYVLVVGINKRIALCIKGQLRNRSEFNVVDIAIMFNTKRFACGMQGRHYNNHCRVKNVNDVMELDTMAYNLFGRQQDNLTRRELIHWRPKYSLGKYSVNRMQRFLYLPFFQLWYMLINRSRDPPTPQMYHCMKQGNMWV